MPREAEPDRHLRLFPASRVAVAANPIRVFARPVEAGAVGQDPISGVTTGAALRDDLSRGAHFRQLIDWPAVVGSLVVPPDHPRSQRGVGARIGGARLNPVADGAGFSRRQVRAVVSLKFLHERAGHGADLIRREVGGRAIADRRQIAVGS